MASLEVGRVVMKVSGREAGKYAVVVKAGEKDKADKTFVTITGPKLLTGVKRRRCNVNHLEPLPYVLEIKEDSSDEDVLAAFEKAKLISKLGLKKPSAAELKADKAKSKEEETKKKEEKPKENKKVKKKKKSE